MDSGSDEFLAMGFDSERLSQAWEDHRSFTGSPDSGEVYIGGFDPDDPGHDDWFEEPAKRHDPGRSILADRQLGRFRMVNVLGEGRHSIVYRALDPLLQRQVAVKRLNPRSGSKTRRLERFLGEARALAQLNHPRIIPIYEAGCDEGRYYIAMELIEGQSLADRLAQGPLSFEGAAEMIRELAEVLAYTHNLGIIHRDIKPANIRLDWKGHAYLLDFGIAYRPDSGELPLSPGLILGTPAYVSPEQARGQTEIRPESDQYSLGAVLYQLLCGRPPFQGPLRHVLFSTIHDEPQPPRSIQPKVPRALDAICRRAMAKQPAQRYPSCRQLADDLQLWLRGKAPSVRRRAWAFLSF